jgi:hypothetical protein
MQATSLGMRPVAAERNQRARALAEPVEIAASGTFDELLDKRNRP